MTEAKGKFSVNFPKLAKKVTNSFILQTLLSLLTEREQLAIQLVSSDFQRAVEKQMKPVEIKSVNCVKFFNQIKKS